MKHFRKTIALFLAVSYTHLSSVSTALFEDGTVVAYGQGVLKKDGSVIEYHGTEIKKLIVNEGVTGIGGSLCYNLPYLKSVFPVSYTHLDVYKRQASL